VDSVVDVEDSVVVRMGDTVNTMKEVTVVLKEVNSAGVTVVVKEVNSVEVIVVVKEVNSVGVTVEDSGVVSVEVIVEVSGVTEVNSVGVTVEDVEDTVVVTVVIMVDSKEGLPNKEENHKKPTKMINNRNTKKVEKVMMEIAVDTVVVDVEDTVDVDVDVVDSVEDAVEMVEVVVTGENQGMRIKPLLQPLSLWPISHMKWTNRP